MLFNLSRNPCGYWAGALPFAEVSLSALIPYNAYRFARGFPPVSSTPWQHLMVSYSACNCKVYESIYSRACSGELTCGRLLWMPTILWS